MLKKAAKEKAERERAEAVTADAGPIAIQVDAEPAALDRAEAVTVDAGPIAIQVDEELPAQRLRSFSIEDVEVAGPAFKNGAGVESGV